MRTQAVFPLERAEHELTPLQEVKAAPVDPVERVLEQRSGVGQIGQSVRLAGEEGLDRAGQVPVEIRLRLRSVDRRFEHGRILSAPRQGGSSGRYSPSSISEPRTV
jgi:hypothetical protein